MLKFAVCYRALVQLTILTFLNAFHKKIASWLLISYSFVKWPLIVLCVQLAEHTSFGGVYSSHEWLQAWHLCKSNECFWSLCYMLLLGGWSEADLAMLSFISSMNACNYACSIDACSIAKPSYCKSRVIPEDSNDCSCVETFLTF